MAEETTPTPSTSGTSVSRHSHWFSVAAFSTIALVGLNTKIVGKVGDQEHEVEWAMIAMSIALGVSGLAVFANLLLRKKFVGTVLEGGFAVITFGVWAGALPAIMKPGNDIATDFQGGVANANLYFFSWGAFIMSLLVFVGYMKDSAKEGMGASLSDFSLNRWAALCLSSFVAMAAAVRIFKSADCDTVNTDFCDRTKLAVSLGTVSGFVALFWTLIGSRLPKILEAVLSCLVLAAWCFGVGYITFGGVRAPGENIGNLFFFTWGSFAVAAQLVASSLDELFGNILGRKNSNEAPRQVLEENKAEGNKDDEETGTADNKDELGHAVTEG